MSGYQIIPEIEEIEFEQFKKENEIRLAVCIRNIKKAFKGFDRLIARAKEAIDE